MQHAAIAEYRLDAQHQLARHAIAHHVQAAGVGAEIAAELAAALGTQAERKVTIRCDGSLLYVLEHAAGLGDHGEVRRIDLADAVHSSQQQQHLPAGGVGRRSAAVAGIARLWHESDAPLVAPAHQRLDLLQTLRLYDAECASVVAAMMIDEQRRGDVRIAEHGIRAEQRAELTAQRGVARWVAHPGGLNVGGAFTVASGARRQAGLVSSICTSPSWRSAKPPSQ